MHFVFTSLILVILLKTILLAFWGIGLLYGFDCPSDLIFDYGRYILQTDGFPAHAWFVVVCEVIADLLLVELSPVPDVIFMLIEGSNLNNFVLFVDWGFPESRFLFAL